MLTFQQVSAGYPRHPVLHAIDLRVRTGEWLGLIGPNGCGKTTLLRVAAGTLRPAQGAVLLQGVELSAYTPRAVARLRACLPQNHSSDFPFRVRDFVKLGRSPYVSWLGKETAEDQAAVENALYTTGLLGLADQPITQISGGERQRAFIAQCLAQEPKLLLLDEPTNHLDIVQQMRILDLLKMQNREHGLTVVAVFHDLNLASDYCDRIAVLRAGRLTTVGAPRNVLSVKRLLHTFGEALHVGLNPKTGKPHVYAVPVSQAQIPPIDHEGAIPFPRSKERENGIDLK